MNISTSRTSLATISNIRNRIKSYEVKIKDLKEVLTVELGKESRKVDFSTRNGDNLVVSSLNDLIPTMKRVKGLKLSSRKAIISKNGEVLPFTYINTKFEIGYEHNRNTLHIKIIRGGMSRFLRSMRYIKNTAEDLLKALTRLPLLRKTIPKDKVDKAKPKIEIDKSGKRVRKNKLDSKYMNNYQKDKAEKELKENQRKEPKPQLSRKEEMALERKRIRKLRYQREQESLV